MKGAGPATVAIVGGGMGGIAAAIDLRTRGFRVKLFEASESLGGKADAVVVDGVECDNGPSVLTLVEVFDALFRLAGTSLANEITLRRPSPFFHYAFGSGASLDVHCELDRTLDSVRASFGTRASSELAAFLAHAGRIWRVASPPFVFGDAPSLRNVFARGPFGWLSTRHLDAFRTLQSAIEAHVRTPELRLLLARYATYNGSDPRHSPATLACIAHVELVHGAYAVEGGICALVRALARTAVRIGVEVELGARIERIVVASGRAVGVELARGRRVDASAVVVNADVGALESLLEASDRRVFRAGPPSMSGWTAILRVPRAARAAHTVAFSDDYARELSDIFDRDIPPRAPTVYACALEPCHGVAGWPREEPLFVMANAPAEPLHAPRPAASWTTLRERVLARLETAGVAARTCEVLWERTPTELARRFPGSRGSLYGTASTSRAAAFLRPPNRIAAPAGLYLASGSAHPGGGLPLVVLSGRAAARALATDFR